MKSDYPLRVDVAASGTRRLLRCRRAARVSGAVVRRRVTHHDWIRAPRFVAAVDSRRLGVAVWYSHSTTTGSAPPQRPRAGLYFLLEKLEPQAAPLVCRAARETEVARHECGRRRVRSGHLGASRVLHVQRLLPLIPIQERHRWQDGQLPPGTTFENVQSLWDFDTKLRSATFSVLQHVETHLRSRLAYALGAVDPMIHRMPELLQLDNPPSTRVGWTSSTAPFVTPTRTPSFITATTATWSFRCGWQWMFLTGAALPTSMVSRPAPFATL